MRNASDDSELQGMWVCLEVGGWIGGLMVGWVGYWVGEWP